ncbi:HAMP domain-containing sensor histidine kinase [soil metagenome]
MTLRRRILLLSTGIAALVLLLLSIPLALSLKQSVISRATSDSEYIAQGVADYVSTSRYDTDQLTAYVNRVNARGDVTVTVQLPDGTSIGAELPAGAPVVRKPQTEDPDRDGDNDGDSLGDVSKVSTTRLDNGRLVQVQAVSSEGRTLVSAYLSNDVVNDDVHSKWAILATACIGLLGIAAIAAEFVSRRMIRPLVSTAETAAQLSQGNLAARAPIEGPAEVAQVAQAINQLADRIDELLASERETVADLSHRLRTPMTAIRLDVEALPDSERVRDLNEHLAELERTLTAVIRAARRPQREGVSPSCDATIIAQDRVAFWSPLAEDQGRTVTVDLPTTPTLVRCASGDLEAALDALLENVIAHTPEGSAFAVTLKPLGKSAGAILEITDQGSGIPDGATLRGRSDRGSSGLGLDIARACAEATGGQLDIINGTSGSTVRMTLLPP